MHTVGVVCPLKMTPRMASLISPAAYVATYQAQPQALCITAHLRIESLNGVRSGWYFQI